MLSFLEGKIEQSDEHSAIVNAGGLGYKITVTPKLANFLKSRAGQTFRFFTHSRMNMREGTFDLFGFDKKEDLDLFHLITSVNGIGPKSAMNILSTVEPRHLKAAIANNDSDSLKKVSGLGSKTAQRLILELKNKVDHIDAAGSSFNLAEEGQAIEALLALGYNAYQSKEALKEVEGGSLQERVRGALKILGKK